MELSTEKNTITKGEWKQKEKKPDGDELDLRLLKYLEDYPDLEGTKYQHKKEQLYLMISWGFSKRKIDFLLDSPITSQDIDFLRLLMLLVDFDFVKENVVGRNFYYEDAIALAAEKLVREKYPAIHEIDRLRREKEEAVKEFSLRMEFLQERLVSEKKIYKMENSHAAELYQKEQELMRAGFGYEKERLEKEIQSLEKETQSLEKQVETLRQDRRKGTDIQDATWEKPMGADAAQINSTAQEKKLGETETPSGWLKKLKRKKQANKNNFIIEIMKNTAFDTEQLKLLNYAFRAGLPEKDIREIAIPELPIMNMEMLLKFFMCSNGIKNHMPDAGEEASEAPADTQGETEMETEYTIENQEYGEELYQDQ